MHSKFPVLVADDDAITRSMLEKLLTRQGYEVHCVENGEQALALFDERFFPIVLSDWMMPGISGLELCKQLRERQTDRYIFIVLLTARDSVSDIVSGLETGADDYLTKPFNTTELSARLNAGARILELERSLRDANAEIHKLSITDPLTGCYNRGYMTDQLGGEIKRATRYQRPLSLILCDIDYFKQINDRHGHQAGDEVLRQFAQLLRDELRQQVDWVARFGGEEFAIVLPETDRNGAAIVAARLCRATRGLGITRAGKALDFTASFGGCTVMPHGHLKVITQEQLLDRADRLLYACKHNGRDQSRVEEFRADEDQG